MKKTLQDILDDLGWNSGFQLPISNAENQALEEEIARLTHQKITTKNKFKNLESRVEALKSHYKFLNQEVDQTQRLITTHKQQLDAQNKLYIEVNHEKRNFEIETKKMEKKIEESEKKSETIKVQLEKQVAKMEKLKAEVDWDEAALVAWEESLKKRDEDNELIKKFSEEDERKYKELESQRVIYQGEYAVKEKTIAKMVCDIQNYELVMERTGKMIKQQEVERDSLVNQWKDTVKILQQRDVDIAKSQEKIIVMQEGMEKYREMLDDQNKFLKIEQDNNRGLHLQIQDLNGVFSKLRKDFSTALGEIEIMTSELGTMKMKIQGAAKQVEVERQKSKEFDKMIYDREYVLIKLSQELEALKAKEISFKANENNSGGRIIELQKMIDWENDQYDALFGETEKLQLQMYHKTAELREIESALRLIQSDIKTMSNIMDHTKRRIAGLKKNLDKHVESAYDFDFRIGYFEKQMYEKDNVDVQIDYEEKEAKILELEETLNEQTKTCEFLNEQIVKIHEEMRRISTAMSLDKHELETLREKLEYQMIFFDISKKQLHTTKERFQEKQVEENMIKYQVLSIEKTVKREDKSILSLKKMRLNLDQAMKERLIEIGANKTILQAKKRSLDEDRGSLKMEMSARNLKLDTLQKKYHMLMMTLGRDEKGQPLSVSHFKIKIAQEKFFLRQQGDTLDQKIKVAEKEIVAMENTLKLVNVSNDKFKGSLTLVNEEGEEMQQFKEMEEQYIQRGFALRDGQKKLLAIEKQLAEAKNVYEEKKKEKDELKEVLIGREIEFRNIRKQENDKAEKLRRANDHVNKLQKKLANVDLEKYYRDFDIRRLKDVNKSVLHELSRLCETSDVAGPKIRYYVLHYGLRLPPPDKSASVSSATSITIRSVSSSSSSDWYKSPRQTQPPSPSAAKVTTLSLNL